MAAAHKAQLPILPPYLGTKNNNFTDGTNFASAGAGALAETNSDKVCDHFPYKTN